MMTDQPTARERIADVAAWCLYHNEHKSMSDPAGVAAERILAIVRETLLSDGPVGAAAMADPDDESYEMEMDVARKEIRRALDAAFGADDDGGER